MEYDESSERIVIDTLDDLRVYVKQNEDPEIQRRRYVREALRALDVPTIARRLITRGSKYAMKRLKVPRNQIPRNAPLCVTKVYSKWELVTLQETQTSQTWALVSSVLSLSIIRRQLRFVGATQGYSMPKNLESLQTLSSPGNCTSRCIY